MQSPGSFDPFSLQPPEGKNMDFTIGKFFAALSITFSLFLLFGHGSSTAASQATQSVAPASASVESLPSPQNAAALSSEHHSASGEGQFMANGQLVGGR